MLSIDKVRYKPYKPCSGTSKSHKTNDHFMLYQNIKSAESNTKLGKIKRNLRNSVILDKTEFFKTSRDVQSSYYYPKYNKNREEMLNN